MSCCLRRNRTAVNPPFRNFSGRPCDDAEIPKVKDFALPSVLAEADRTGDTLEVLLRVALRNILRLGLNLVPENAVERGIDTHEVSGTSPNQRQISRARSNAQKRKADKVPKRGTKEHRGRQAGRRSMPGTLAGGAGILSTQAPRAPSETGQPDSHSWVAVDAFEVGANRNRH